MSRRAMAFLLLFLLCSCCYFISASHSETDNFPGSAAQRLGASEFKKQGLQAAILQPWHNEKPLLRILFNIPPEWTYFPYNQKAVWVANRDNPIPDASGSLGIDINGVFRILYNGGNSIVHNSFSETRSNLSATLLDSGNLVLREHNSDGSTGKVLWQSFDYPTNILLPGMKLGINFKTGHRWSLTSWISSEAPGSGSFTYGGDPNGTSQLFIWWHGDVYWSSGLWREGRFDNAPRLNYHDYYRFNYVSNEDEKYLTYTVTANHSLARFSLDTSGNVLESGGTTTYGACSLWGIVYPGCAEKVLPECRKGDVWFERKQGYSFGESFKFSDSSNMSLFDCQDKCLQNCSCVAYASIDDNGAGCEIWSSPLDFATVEINGRIIYVLVSGRGKKWWIWLIIAVGALLLVLGFSFYVLGKKQRVKGKRKAAEKMLLYELGGSTNPPTKFSSSKNHRKDKKMIHGLNIFSFESIFAATSNFSISNKLGEGGFGPVYKGKLDDGQEVAIKRLSRSSGQGLVEFKNEIVLISKLQHTNLVRLLGCCIQGEERILVYEYMPQKSLDFFLFDCSRRELLDWTSRWNIIGGIAQGLLYLHKYSRLKVIHRDLKASNILLDDGMNPKISDFGMARIFELQESEINTNRVVGTYGYMAPEYAINGIVSMKTDIFSFGVLLLEIVSGKRNNSFHNSEYAFNLVGYAWELWKEGRAQELMDPTLDHHSRSCNEVMRCIHVALLCVQDRAAERPSMSDIVSMLINETLELPTPNKPVFFIEMGTREDEKDDKAEKYSINELTISVTEAR